MAKNSGKSLDTSLRYGSIGVEREDVGKFPFDAFSFETPDTDAPELTLNSPWVFDVEKLIADELTVTTLTNNGLIEDREFLTATDDYVISSAYKNVYLTFTRQATDKTITLPDATGNLNQEIIIEVTGSGVGNVSLIGDSIDGITATNWIWHGIGKLKILSTGTLYKILDHGVWDSYIVGNNSSYKYTNKVMLQRLVAQSKALALVTSPSVGVISYIFNLNFLSVVTTSPYTYGRVDATWRGFEKVVSYASPGVLNRIDMIYRNSLSVQNFIDSGAVAFGFWVA